MTATDKLGTSWMLWIPFDPSARREEVGVTWVYYRATDKGGSEEGRKEGRKHSNIADHPALRIHQAMNENTLCLWQETFQLQFLGFFLLLQKSNFKDYLKLTQTPNSFIGKCFRWGSSRRARRFFLDIWVAGSVNILHSRRLPPGGRGWDCLHCPAQILNSQLDKTPNVSSVCLFLNSFIYWNSVILTQRILCGGMLKFKLRPQIYPYKGWILLLLFVSEFNFLFE